MLRAKKLLSRLLSYIKLTSVNATKVGNYYTNGSITAYKRNGIVQLKVDGISLVALTERTTVAQLPVGYRPPSQSYGVTNALDRYFLIETNGDIKFNAGTAANIYACTTFVAVT